MRILGLVALGASIALTACSGSSAEGPQGLGTTTGTGGAPSGTGSVPSVGTPGVVTGGSTPSANAGATPGIAGASFGAGGAVVVGAGGAPTPGTPGGGAPAGGTPAGGAPAGGAPSGGGASGAGTVDPPGTVTMKTDGFQLQPGQEVYKCQNFDNPFGGKDTAVKRFVTDMAKGSHHLHVYNLTEGTGRSLEDCTSGDFHAIVHGAGTEHAETDYPDGMATKIKGASGLRIQLHYLNTTLDVLSVGATLKLTPVADISTITKWVAELYLNRIGLSVPPGQGQSITTSCTLPNTYGQVGLVVGLSHMHRRGIREVATTSTGVQLMDVNTWDEPPPITYDPPIMMNPGDSITWTCTYNNDTGMTLTFGDSALTNEMCIYLARYYSTNANDTQVACQAASANGGIAQPQSY